MHSVSLLESNGIRMWICHVDLTFCVVVYISVQYSCYILSEYCNAAEHSIHTCAACMYSGPLIQYISFRWGTHVFQGFFCNASCFNSALLPHCSNMGQCFISWFGRRLIVTADPQWPAATVSGTLPSLTFHLNERKVSSKCVQSFSEKSTGVLWMFFHQSEKKEEEKNNEINNWKQWQKMIMNISVQYNGFFFFHLVDDI